MESIEENTYIAKFNQVGVFHRTFGHPIYTTPQYGFFTETPDVAKLRLALIAEEVAELNEACDTHDFVELVDALCDILYVAYGTYHTMGYIPRYENTYIYKLSVDSTPLLDIFEQNNALYIDSRREINVIMDAIKESFESQIYDYAVSAISRLIIECHLLSQILGVNIDACFNEVQRSNMSKGCVTLHDAERSVMAYQEKGISAGYKQSESEDYWIIYNTETNKILKSVDYQAPNLEPIICFA